MLYKLYIKKNGIYKNPKIYHDFDEAVSHAEGEYLIIKETDDGTNTILTHDIKSKNEKRRDDEWSR